MTIDPFEPLLVAGWLTFAALAGYAFATAPPAQVEAPVQVEVPDAP